MDNPLSTIFVSNNLKKESSDHHFYDQILVPLKTHDDYLIDVSYSINDKKTLTNLPYKTFEDNSRTLLKGSPETRFTYKVPGLSKDQIKKVNSLDVYDISAKINLILSFGGDIRYHKIKSRIFFANLEIIDYHFHYIIALALVYHYDNKSTTCRQIVNYLRDVNPQSLDRLITYDQRIAKFLVSLLFGLNDRDIWPGLIYQPGGYHVSTENGDMYLYLIDNQKKFENLLIDNTVLDFPSAVDCDFGYIYEEDGNDPIDLCLGVKLI